MNYDELIMSLRTDHDKYFARDMEAADAIEELQQTANHYKGCADDWYKEACDYKDAVPKWTSVKDGLPKAENYISREAALNACCEGCSAARDCRPGERCVDYMRIKEIPAADVREVRRGKWIESKREPVQNSNWEIVYWKCSECGIEIHTTLPKFEIRKWRFCVNCGAKMEEQT